MFLLTFAGLSVDLDAVKFDKILCLKFTKISHKHTTNYKQITIYHVYTFQENYHKNCNINNQNTYLQLVLHSVVTVDV